MDRDYTVAERIGRLPDDILVTATEISQITGLAEVTIQQRRIKDFPGPIPNLRRLRWRLGDIRSWIKGRTQLPTTDQKTDRGDKTTTHLVIEPGLHLSSNEQPIRNNMAPIGQSMSSNLFGDASLRRRRRG